MEGALTGPLILEESMGLTSLRTKFRDSSKHTWWGILLVLGLALMLPVFFGMGGSGMRRQRDPSEQKRLDAIAEQDKPVAIVGEEKITRGSLIRPKVRCWPR